MTAGGSASEVTTGKYLDSINALGISSRVWSERAETPLELCQAESSTRALLVVSIDSTK
jgi:hypothetical protein